MANPDRLSGLDSSFLHLEQGPAHMHVGLCLIFDGPAPEYEEFVQHVESRLHLVPRYRQRLAFVPYEQGRPQWVDDPYFNIRYHVRQSALPPPETESELKRFCGRFFSQRLDRNKPLWELYLVESVEGDRFAVVGKNHHCLVDGVSGVDIAAVLFDLERNPEPLPEPEPWVPRPLPSSNELLADALLERATAPREVARGVRAFFRGPRKVAEIVRDELAAVGAFAWAGFDPAPHTPLNEEIGPHRRFSWVKGDLAQFKAIKNKLGGTVNDVVVAVVAEAIGSFLRQRGFDTTGKVLKAQIPVSVRAEADRGALGNRVALTWAPLPIGEDDPLKCYEIVHEALSGLKESGQAVGAQLLTELSGFAPPTILAQAARLQNRQRLFNLLITNIPGPQFPLYLLGREMQSIFPQAPLGENQAIDLAIMSYNGELNFGILGDYDVLDDIEDFTDDLRAAISALAQAAGVEQRKTRSRKTSATNKRARAQRAAASANGSGASSRAATKR